MEQIIKDEYLHHKLAPHVDYTMLKVLRREEELENYLEQKYYRHAISGVINNLNIDTINKMNPKLKGSPMPYNAKCKYCNMLFSREGIRDAHMRKMTCIKRDEIVKVQKMYSG